jgi:hypothetical protein
MTHQEEARELVRDLLYALADVGADSQGRLPPEVIEIRRELFALEKRIQALSK